MGRSQVDEPDISLIVPVYRIREADLRQCIESMIGQTYKKIEIILIDDGSPDNCGRICDEYSEKDGRIRVIHQENQGVSVARNVGIDNAAGMYLMFVDSDDWLELDCCERTFSAIQEQNCDVLMFGRRMEWDRGSSALSSASRKLSEDELRKLRVDSLIGCDDKNLGIYVTRVPWGKLIPTEFIKKHELRFISGIKRSQDNIFALYMFDRTENVYYLDYIGYHYRGWDSSVTFRYNEQMPEMVKSFIHEMDRFISLYHENSSIYYRAMGARCMYVFSDIEHCLLFHEDSKLLKSDCVQIAKEYFNDRTVKKYFGACKISDIRFLRNKMRSFLFRRGWYNIYYWMAKMFFTAKHFRGK